MNSAYFTPVGPMYPVFVAAARQNGNGSYTVQFVGAASLFDLCAILISAEEMDQVSFSAAQTFAVAQALSGAPAVLSPAEGLMQLWVFGILTTLKISGNETSGAFAMHEDLVPPGSPGPPTHSHTREDEYFYVTEGELTWIFDGKDHIAPKGSFVHIPRGLLHGFANRSGKYARALVMYTPAKFQEFFIKVGMRTEGASVNSFPAPEPKQEDYKMALHWMEVYGLGFTPPAEHGHGEL